jgi:hypothetical protein
MNRSTLLKVLTLILILSFSAVAVSAQSPEVTAEPTPPANTLEITGAIESVDGNIIALYGEAYDISEALIDDDVRLVVGEFVELYIQLGAEGMMTVFLVDDVDAGDDRNEIEIKGIVEALETNSITIGGITLDTTNAVFEDRVAVGERAEVYVAIENGTWVATRVDDDMNDDSSDDSSSDDFMGDRDEDYELRGTLEEIGEGFIVVNGRTIDTSRAGFDDDVAVGLPVEVEFYMIDGELVALYVDDLDDMDRDDDDFGVDEDDVPAGTVAAITAAEAAAIALEVFPNATVSEIELDTRYGGTLVWEVELSNDVEIYIDATTGVRIEIDDYRDGRNDDDDWDDRDDSRDDDDRDDDRDDRDDDDDDDWDDDRDDDDDDDDDDRDDDDDDDDDDD